MEKTGVDSYVVSLNWKIHGIDLEILNAATLVKESDHDFLFSISKIRFHIWETF